ncbi:MAG: PAS domain-containing protein [Bacteroidota bacterium]
MKNQSDLHFMQSENIFRTLIEESLTPVGLYVGDDLIIKVANKAIINIWGKGADVIDKPYFEVLPELRKQGVYKILYDVYNTGVAYEATEDRVDLVVDGKLQIHYFNFSFKPLKDADGNVWGVLNTAADVTELARIRQQLAESEERTQFALNAADLGTWDFNPATEEIIWDERCQELFGFRKTDTVKYKDALKCVHPEDAAYLNSKVQESIDPKLRKPYDIKYRTIGIENKHIRWLRAIGNAKFNDDNVCTRFAGTVEDITREIADQKALTDSEHLLQNITTAAPISLWMWNEEGNITYTNKTWMEWTGMAYEEIMGAGWLNAIVAEDRKRTADKFMADLAARRPYEVNFRILNKGGDIRWCIATGNPQYRTDGSFAGYIGACTDITEKTLAEHQLQLKNEELNDQIKQFEFVTGFMPVQLWTATINGELDYVNQRTLDFFGVEREKIIGPEWILHVHPDDRDDCAEAWSHSLQTGELYQFEFRLRDKDGNYKWHLARALPFITDGKIIKWFGTNTDIDEQKILQRQKDDFLGIASHELKTPVTSIKAYAQVLGAMLTKEGETRKAEMVLRMDAQVNRLTNLIGDLLDVTKINSGKLQFNKTWFDFNNAISETVEDLQHTTNKHKLIKEFTKTGEIFSDKDRISQVITNLITNAIKYSPYSDQIIIKTKMHEGQVMVSVVDFGIGIPADKTELIFEQFYRVSGNKEQTFPGLGLGLYISSEIIKRESGKIWVNSVEGKGSDFCFTLPVNNQRADN